jgi:tripartite-type tricarboxylate transporter receptor subunit TctC
MRRNIIGSALTVTVGWEHNVGVNNAILIPSTFVAVASILIVLFAQCLKWVRGTAIEHVDFDPNEPLELMAAASAGGMVDTFAGLTKNDLEEGGGKKVILGQVGAKDGLVQVG